MNNRVLVTVFVPKLEMSYDIFIPIGRKVKSVIKLLSKAISDLSNGVFPENGGKVLCNQKTGIKYDYELLIKETDIRNGTDLTLL